MALSGLFFGLHQNMRIASAEAQATIGARKAESAERRIEFLEDRVDRLALLNLALWTLLQEREGLTEDELQQRVQELDLRDGKLDGRVQSGVIECPQCNRPLSQRHRKCMYCEYELNGGAAFDSVVR